MRFSTVGLTNKEMSDMILEMGVPAFTASLSRIEYVEEPNGEGANGEGTKSCRVGWNDSEEREKTPIWTFEDLLHVCRVAQIADRVKERLTDVRHDYADISVLILTNILEEEYIMDEEEYRNSYLESLVDFMEINPELFDYSKLEERQFWDPMSSEETPQSESAKAD